MSVDHRSGTADQAYLDLVKRCITNYPYRGADADFEALDPFHGYDLAAGRWAVDRITIPFTLLRKDQLDLIERLLVDCDRRDVPGDLIEAGVWRGGTVAFMRALTRIYDRFDRTVVAADSFAGIPLSTQFRHDLVNRWPDRWIATLDEVRGNIARLGLLDNGVQFLPGLFEDTLHRLAERRFALIRLDADAYDSTMTALDHLYPLVSPGGVVIIDDWHLVGCKLAVEAYRSQHGIDDPIVVTAGNAWWIKQTGPDQTGEEREQTRRTDVSDCGHSMSAPIMETRRHD